MVLIITLSSRTLGLVSTLSAEWNIQHQVIRHHHSRCSKPHNLCYQEDGWSASLINLEYSSTLETSYQPMTVSRGRRELFTGEGPSLLLLINIVCFLRKHGGFCLETQKFPDSINQPSFPSVVIRPGQQYTHNVLYKFGC